MTSTIEIIGAVFLILLAYIMGSIPTGYIACKKLKNIDIRQVGSGSTGATNVKRVLGTKWFFIVMVIDAIKGFIPVFAATYFYKYTFYTDLFPVLTGAAAVIGHSKSVFLKFTGGKSVAVSIGTILALNPLIGFLAVVVWGAISFLTKYVSLGSVIAMCMVTVFMNLYNQSLPYIIYASACAVFVIALHRENIVRLVSGKENKVRK